MSKDIEKIPTIVLSDYHYLLLLCNCFVTVANAWFKPGPTTPCWVDALAVNPLSLAVKYAQLVPVLPLCFCFAIVFDLSL